MVPDKEELDRIDSKSQQMRISTIKTVYWSGGGHLGGALSVIDILSVLYFHTMRIDINNPNYEERDRMIMSKGHAGIGIVPFLADLGFINKDLLKTYNHTNSSLGMHLDMRKVPGVDASTGSLGHGLPIGAGLALSAKLLNKNFNIFVILGDGECNEGSIWEAAMAINHYKLTNLITIIDRNHLMYDGETEKVMSLEPLKDKWISFGFRTLEIDGHNIMEICRALDSAVQDKSMPSVIICNTVKGCGVKAIENTRESHYVSIKDEAVLDNYIASVNEYHTRRAEKWEN